MFVASGISNESLEAISVKALPLVAINIVAVIIIVIFPQLSLWLPALVE